MSYIKAVPSAANCVRIDTSAVSMSTTNQDPNDGAPKRSSWSLPDWLDGRTIALATTVVSAALALGTMMQTSHSRLASDIHQVRQDLSADIEKVRHDVEKVRDELGADIAKLDDRLRSVEIDVAAIRTAMTGFDVRLRAVEEHARHPVASPPAG